MPDLTRKELERTRKSWVVDLDHGGIPCELDGCEACGVIDTLVATALHLLDANERLQEALEGSADECEAQAERLEGGEDQSRVVSALLQVAGNLRHNAALQGGAE